MKFPRHVGRHARRAAPAAILAALLSCSSDPESTLGSDSDLIGSEPGEVYQDTLGVFADTVIATNTLIVGSSVDSTLVFGRAQGYERSMLIQPGFSLGSGDANRTVRRAHLRLITQSITGSFPARFYLQDETYTEGDEVASLDLANAIPDTNGVVDRAMESLPATYSLPPDLVQRWIREDSTRAAIAIVYTDAVNERLASFKSGEARKDRPALWVDFTDGHQGRYTVSHDAVFIRPLNPTSNLIVSDGYARRIHFRVDLDEVPVEAAVHTARVRFHLVPGTVLGTNTTLVVYIPDSADPARDGFRSGQLVTETTFSKTDDTIEFTLTNALFLVLQGTLEDNGFVIRFRDENTELRQVEFYGTAAPEPLRPRVFITASSPAEFSP